MSTRDKSSYPDAVDPTSAGIFRFATLRPPRQAAADRPRASIDLGLLKCSLADSLRKIPAMRASLRHILRRPGQRLWLLLHAPRLLDGPDSAAQAIALHEDDYRRLAARQETREQRASGTASRRHHEHAPIHKQKASPHE
jgi:hypothetical protein